MPIKDSHYRIIGYIETDRDGRQRALNARFRIVGHFDPVRGETKDGTFRIVARGNTLAALIWDARLSA